MRAFCGIAGALLWGLPGDLARSSESRLDSRRLSPVRLENCLAALPKARVVSGEELPSMRRRIELPESVGRWMRGAAMAQLKVNYSCT